MNVLSKTCSIIYILSGSLSTGQSWFEMQEQSGEGRSQSGEDPSSHEELASCAAELNEVEPRCRVCRDRCVDHFA